MCAPSGATSVRCSSAAVSSRSAPTSTSGSPAFWAGAASALLNASTLYTLPVSLFGMSVSAAELPAMSGEAGLDNAPRASPSRCRPAADRVLRRPLRDGVPRARGRRRRRAVPDRTVYARRRGVRVGDRRRVGGRPAGLDAGPALFVDVLRAARHDGRRCATPSSVSCSPSDSVTCARSRPRRCFGVDLKWGTAGLTASAGVAGWIEFLLLRRGIAARLGATGIPAMTLARLWGSALIGCAVAWAAKLLVGTERPLITAAAVLPAVRSGVPRYDPAVGRS